MNPEFTVGTDVEFFLNHPDAGFVPATGFNCSGTKLEPTQLGELGAYHRDNISVELQPPPATNPDKFIGNNLNLYNAMTTQFRGMQLEMRAYAAVRFDEARLKDLEEAEEMGCEPDKCAYAGETMVPAKVESMGRYRTGSGHIHIGGIEDMDENARRDVVKWLDILEGLYGRYMEGNRDRQAYRRRTWYGQAGRYRMKDYGLEWRTPSNVMWAGWVLDASAYGLFASIYSALTLVRAGITVDSIAPEKAIERIRQSIDGQDGKACIRRIHYWQDKLYEYDEIKTVLKKAGKLYGNRANIFSA